ncbi:thymidine kinase, partial [Enteropsectra breve]
MLKFISGTVASGKTLELLTKAHQFGPKQNAKHIKILKPSIDTRYARDVVRSASGMQVTATDVIGPFDNLHSLNYTDISLILVDEIQFFTITQIQQLREISYTYGMSVYCYGILKDFKNKIFDSSAFLISICDSFKFVKCYCALCERAQGEP